MTSDPNRTAPGASPEPEVQFGDQPEAQSKTQLIYQLRSSHTSWQEVDRDTYLTFKPNPWMGTVFHRRVLQVVFEAPDQSGPVSNPEQEFLP